MSRGAVKHTIQGSEKEGGQVVPDPVLTKCWRTGGVRHGAGRRGEARKGGGRDRAKETGV